MAKLSLFDRRRRRVRSSLRARAAGKPRLSVHRSGRHIYAQVIDDAAGKTLASASTLDKDIKGKTGATKDGAATVGKTLAERAKKAGVSSVVFDRGGFLPQDFLCEIQIIATAIRGHGLLRNFIALLLVGVELTIKGFQSDTKKPGGRCLVATLRF